MTLIRLLGLLILFAPCVSSLEAQRVPADLPALAPAAGAVTIQQAPRGTRIDLPLVDLPYNIAHGVRAPSMAQSLAVTEAFYEFSHTGIERLWGDRKWLSRLSIGLWDYFTLVLPFADAWLHEEFHRAVLGNRDIDSFNDVYQFKLGATVIAVSHVRDEDLVQLKRDHPAEQVRLGAAGIEGEYQLVQRLQTNRFRGRSGAWHLTTYWLAKFGSLVYVMSGVWDEVNEETDEMNEKDGADVERRDFTGHDFTAWVYDLHRPAEPYAARGVHPSGVGIDRYIKPADLTAEEFDYLERQGKLQLLNLLDPHLLGLYAFTFTNPLNHRPLRFNISAGHQLTSFGHTVDGNLFLQQDAVTLMLVLHRYENAARKFAGVDAQLFDYPVAVRGLQLAASPRLAIWQQPQDGDFRTTSADLGGLIGLRVHRAHATRLGMWAEVQGKSGGWVAGIEQLHPSASMKLGLSVTF